MSSAANITSIEAVRELRAGLLKFAEQARSALVALELEARRPVEWVEHDRSRYWPREAQRASDRLSEARQELARCELATSGEDRRYCYDERKALERARRRLSVTEEKVQAVRRWRIKLQREVEEFDAQVAKMSRFLDADFVQGVAALERIAATLDRYVQQRGPAPADTDRGQHFSEGADRANG
jgi:hypothetical protein